MSRFGQIDAVGGRKASEVDPGRCDRSAQAPSAPCGAQSAEQGSSARPGSAAAAAASPFARTAKYIVALDQGTTSSRALLVDRSGKVLSSAQEAFEQHYPQPGWVEHDPFDILGTQLGVLRRLLVEAGISAQDVAAIGITNQRETTVVWDARTGMPFGRAIVWQCRRTAPIVDKLCEGPEVHERIVDTTGLVPDAYFSASKVKWILDNVEGAREAADAGHARFGTVDSWLVYNLTGGKVHATDYTNASRTMLFDIRKACWSPWLCELFGVPESMLPEVRPSAGSFGVTAKRIPAAQRDDSGMLASSQASAPAFADLPAEIPIMGVAGDQQAALFGHCCVRPGQAKNTYGTGCFLLMHTGSDAVRSQSGLVTTIAAQGPGESGLHYALEGSVFVAGALVQWLRDEMGLMQNAAESEALARSVENTAGVVVVPAFTGLGAPYWDAQARGAIYGLTRGATRAHVVRAALESLAYQVCDLVDAIERDAGFKLEALAVDGGASANDFLMQFQADVLGCPIERPANVETTAMGAAYLAGLACGLWRSVEEIAGLRTVSAHFEPKMDAEQRRHLLEAWAECVVRTRSGA